MSGLPSVDQSYGTEVMRKSIHLSSIAIPVIYYFISKSTALTILIPLALAFGLSDLARVLHPPTGKLYESLFGFLLRARERTGGRKRLNGATYVLLSAILCVWLFPKVIVLTAFAILIVSDTSAALVGRKFGRHPFLGKSVEGTMAFFISALVVVALAPKISYTPTEYLIGVVAALVGTFVELLSGTIDDNLSVPISIGTVMWLLYGILLPSINVFQLDRLT